EASFFGANEAEAEIGSSEAAHEAALTEVLAAEASHCESQAEAAAMVGTMLPLALRTMGASSSLRYVLPTLTRANARLGPLMHQPGPAGRELLRLLPTVMRATIASLRAAQRRGVPLTPALAEQIIASQVRRVFGQHPAATMVRNATIRRQTVAPARAT